MKKGIFYIFYFLVLVFLFIGLITLNQEHILVSLLTILLFLIVGLFSRKTNFPFALKLLIFLFIFSGLVLGELFDFYNKYPCFDNILHFVSGIITGFFALSLVLMFLTNSKKKFNPYILGVFIMSFSLSVGVLWEFLEFNVDKYLGINMQKDTYVDHINLSNINNSIIKIDDILYTDLYTKDRTIRINNYLDIGLIDTVGDLETCFFGSLATTIFICFVIRRDKDDILKYLIITKK